MKSRCSIVFVLTALTIFSPTALISQTSQDTQPSDTLRQLNRSIEALVERVSPSVVQIVVTDTARLERLIEGKQALLLGDNARLALE